jgi:hypothetical protein
MTAPRQAPTQEQIRDARRVLAAHRQATLRARRRAGRSLTPGKRVYPMAAFLCGYCRIAFESRRGNYGKVRYCSHSCRSMAYDRRHGRSRARRG